MLSISAFYLLPFTRYNASKFQYLIIFIFFSSYYFFFLQHFRLSTTFVPLTLFDFDETFTEHRAPMGDEKNV